MLNVEHCPEHKQFSYRRYVQLTGVAVLTNPLECDSCVGSEVRVRRFGYEVIRRLTKQSPAGGKRGGETRTALRVTPVFGRHATDSSSR
jgi:hypothetical protein